MMARWLRLKLWQKLIAPALLVILGGFWFLPISGQVIVIPGSNSQALVWPQMQLRPLSTGIDAGRSMEITDVVPWTNVLLTVDGRPVTLENWTSNPGGTWTWKWTFVSPNMSTSSKAGGTEITFYHDCDSGCIERSQANIAGISTAPEAVKSPAGKGVPTKLGVVFADPARDWHGRSGWDVELTYARLSDKDYWGIDDLAARVHRAQANGLRVLVRVDYDQGQSIPPTNDNIALTEYLHVIQRLARDDRFRGVYGYIIGSSYNALDSNTLAPDHPVTAEWYARVFNGYGESVSRTDNVVQTIQAQNSATKVLVGPVRPWVRDQAGAQQYSVDASYLHYMNSLVSALNEETLAKGAAGIAMTAPDGFAVQAPGRISSSDLAGRDGSAEPVIDLRKAEWGGAQAGFRVYRDWIDIINAYSTTRGSPVYITSSNTFAPDDGTPPAQNYPKGWLTNALQAANSEPQIQALIWFTDGPPGDKQWEPFNLSRRLGRLTDADNEFQSLLQGGR